MSTRKLILAALLCGVAILVAGTVLLWQLGRVDPGKLPPTLPDPTTTTARP